MFRNSINAARRLGLGIQTKAAVVGGSVMTAAGVAHAEVPTEVSTALATTATDVGTVAGLAFAIFLVVVGFRYMRSGAR